MAKSAKEPIPEITPKVVNAITKNVLQNYEQIETLRGRFMEHARRYRDQISNIYESAASKGIPQRVMKLQIEIERLRERINGKIADLDAEHHKLLQKIAKARGNKAQLSLVLDVPLPKPTKAEKATAVLQGATTNGQDRTEGTTAS